MAAEGFIPIEACSGETSSASKIDVCLKNSSVTLADAMSGAGFNRNEALRYHVLMVLEPSASCFETLFCDCIITLVVARKVYNNDNIIFFSVYQRLQSPRVIMCCSPHHFAERAATHYHTRAWQTLIHGKECFILL